MPDDIVSSPVRGTFLGTNLYASPFITVDVGSIRKPAPARISGQMPATTGRPFDGTFP